MKTVPSNYAATTGAAQSSAELLILPDGRILAHNITPRFAVLLAELNPGDEAMLQRATLQPAPAAGDPALLSTSSHSPVVRSALLPRP